MADLFFLDGYQPEMSKSEMMESASSHHPKGKLSVSNSFGELEQELLGGFGVNPTIGMQNLNQNVNSNNLNGNHALGSNLGVNSGMGGGPMPENMSGHRYMSENMKGNMGNPNNLNNLNGNPNNLNANMSGVHIGSGVVGNKRNYSELEEDMNPTKRTSLNQGQQPFHGAMPNSHGNPMGNPMGNPSNLGSNPLNPSHPMYLQQVHHMQQLQAMREQQQQGGNMNVNQGNAQGNPMMNAFSSIPPHLQTQLNAMSPAQRSQFFAQMMQQQQRQLRTSGGHMVNPMVNYNNINALEQQQQGGNMNVNQGNAQGNPMMNAFSSIPPHLQTQLNAMSPAQRSQFFAQMMQQQQRQLRTSGGHMVNPMVNYNNINANPNGIPMGNPSVISHSLSSNPSPNSPYSPYSWNGANNPNPNANLNANMNAHNSPFSPPISSPPPMNVISISTPPPFSPASNAPLTPVTSYGNTSVQRNSSMNQVNAAMNQNYVFSSSPLSTNIINNMNQDCLSTIFSFLTIRDLAKVSLVCRRWHAMAWKSAEVVDLTQSWNFFTKPTAKHCTENILKQWFNERFDPMKVHTINAWGCEAFNNNVMESIAKNQGYQRNLRTLNVRMTRVNSEGIKWICQLTFLQHLTLMNSISDRDVNMICKNLTQLQSLMLISSNVAEAGLNDIAQLRYLRELQLTGCERVGDTGIAKLKPLASLKSLWLSCTGVTDQGMQHLIALSNLKTLVVTNCKITDQGLKYLILLEQLENLSLSYCYLITSAGVEQLSRSKNISINLFGVRNGSG
eukprot:TRINITY_DN6740_c0_g1_i3.p1 TRINITY_DN6740_c0_g1~~TRINITY_DN6740_c0_g1_i3.p1  ORF type:complete len:783 (-),score=243.72 TRINITY_DN6740_c0_g1_i3:42-2390(-)